AHAGEKDGGGGEGAKSVFHETASLVCLQDRIIRTFDHPPHSSAAAKEEDGSFLQKVSGVMDIFHAAPVPSLDDACDRVANIGRSKSRRIVLRVKKS
ncbi:MAG: hypothetical protein U1A06_12870, partial [Hoeflea sp.]|nr:hypothetical protein [Hoeflea sp.]